MKRMQNIIMVFFMGGIEHEMRSTIMWMEIIMENYWLDAFVLLMLNFQILYEQNILIIRVAHF